MSEAGALRQNTNKSNFEEILSQNQYAYTLQYISLMIIILSFVIGAFTSKQIADQKQIAVESADSGKAEVKKHPEMPADLTGVSASFGAMKIKIISGPSYAKFFEESATVFNSDNAEALRTILLSHDLLAKIEIAVSEAGFFDVSAEELAFARAERLFNFLTSNNVPAEAIEITLTPGLKQQLSVSFVNDAETRDAAYEQ